MGSVIKTVFKKREELWLVRVKQILIQTQSVSVQKSVNAKEIVDANLAAKHVIVLKIAIANTTVHANTVNGLTRNCYVSRNFGASASK